ncbi:DUF2252 domain-containing protein [Mucilaginibacter paludis]|uniref:DUF2252 domain-containing protein n=1 Tax=Mucilaginibacter paludis DSM 18603 TaxID=714943 RepID=H1Y8V6_9SPHI|nr:DUF2252 family protein [Mucilaginibacter paludis]EHQ28722.1 Protein of unknown function DUF2252 [Mucilaginibacter paludis DSM 18603]
MSKLIERILKFNQGLLPEMLPYKYEAMAENPFRFYRGTCHLFYEDLQMEKAIAASPLTWICGDLHLENFGSYRGENGLVYFDLNDFDESVLAPASFEVVRLITSIFIGFDSLDIEQKKADKMARLFLKTYSTTLAAGKAISIEPRTAKGIVRDFLTAAEKSKAKDLLEKRTEKKSKKLVLSLTDERHFKLDRKLKADLTSHISDWISTSSDGPYNYKVKGCVFRLAGTGSIGVKRYLFLLKSTNTRNNYLLIDMKQSRPSSVSPFVHCKQPAWAAESERIITAQRHLQNVTPSLLSTTDFRGDTYVIQELQPVKDSIKFKMIRDQYRDLYLVIDDMALLTASAQLRSGGRGGSAIIDELSAFGKNPDWQEPLLDYARKYAATVKKYYNQYIRSYEAGKLTR